MSKTTIQISQPVCDETEWNALQEPIQTGWLTQGPKVAEFEKLFATEHNAKHSIAVTSCTTGLHLALAAIGIGPDDEVIVPAFSWIASANVILHCGATPVFVDIEKNTFNIDIKQVEKAISKKTKAVMAVHLFGLCANITDLKNCCPPHIKIIEDAACATGAKMGEAFAGTLGDAGVFSFHPRKIITTGEGGMVTTEDTDLAEIMVQMRNHGATLSEEQRHLGSKPYILPDFNLLGYNYRMTDLQGAVGVIQMQRLNKLLEERRQWARFYSEKLQHITWLQPPQEPEGFTHSWQSYVTYVDAERAPGSRNEIMDQLYSKGISTRPGTHALHIQNYYKNLFGFQSEDFPNAFNAHMNSMAIPLHNKMSEEDFQYVVETFQSI